MSDPRYACVVYSTQIRDEPMIFRNLKTNETYQHQHYSLWLHVARTRIRTRHEHNSELYAHRNSPARPRYAKNRESLAILLIMLEIRIDATISKDR